MSPFSRLAVARTIVTVVLALFPRQAGAHCGLENCPAGVDDTSVESVRWSASVEVRQTETDYLEIPVSYSQYVPRVDLRGTWWRVGAVAPIVTLRFLEQTQTGFGNPLFILQGRVVTRPAYKLDAGLQIEAPWGDTEDGLADDHTMLVPYVNAEWPTYLVDVDVSVGYRFVVLESGEASQASSAASHFGRTVQFHSGHYHGVAETVIDPHTDREVLWRAEVSSARPLWRVTPSLLLDAQHVVGDEPGEDFFLNGGVELRVRVSNSIAIEGMGFWPMTTASRYDRRVALSLRLY